MAIDLSANGSVAVKIIGFEALTRSRVSKGDLNKSLAASN